MMKKQNKLGLSCAKLRLSWGTTCWAGLRVKQAGDKQSSHQAETISLNLKLELHFMFWSVKCSQILRVAQINFETRNI